MKKIIKIKKLSIDQAVENSARIEGMSLKRAKKDVIAIKLLKKHGRAFSI